MGTYLYENERGRFMNKKLSFTILSFFMMITLIGCSFTPAGESVQDEHVQESQEGQLTDLEESSNEEQDTSSEVTEPSTEVTTAPEAAPSDGQGIENTEFAISLDQAIETFYSTFGSDTINIDKIEFDKDDGRYKYEISGWDEGFEYDLDVDAETGDVLDQEKDQDNDTDNIIDLGQIISPSEAMSIAITEAGSGYVKDWELDGKINGNAVYEIDIENGPDQHIDAYTGEILR